MTRTLSAEKTDAMWAAWQEKQTLYSVAKKCKVAYASVKKYRKLDNWDKRLAKINGKAMVKADATLTTRRAKQIAIVDQATKSYFQQLLGRAEISCPHCKRTHTHKIPKLKAGFRDIDVLVRLQEFLAGEADSHEKKTLVIEHVYRDEHGGPRKTVESEVIENV